jgi:ABC-2 type transport system permease protein
MSGRRAITLVAVREVRERLRSRAFLASTVVMLAIVGASAAFARVYAPERAFRVAVAAPAPSGLDAAPQRAAKPFDATVRLRVLGSASAGREELQRGRLTHCCSLAPIGSSSK